MNTIINEVPTPPRCSTPGSIWTRNSQPGNYYMLIVVDGDNNRAMLNLSTGILYSFVFKGPLEVMEGFEAHCNKPVILIREEEREEI